MRVLLLLLLCIWQSECWAQQKLLFVTDNKLQENYAASKGIGRAYFIYQSEFTDARGEFDKDKLVRSLSKKIPNIKAKGFAVLDWEGEAMQMLIRKKKKSDLEYNEVLQTFIDCISEAQALRPNIKWSYYGLPYREYWGINKNWTDNNLALNKLFKKMDFIAPSIYILYTPEESNKTNDIRYIEENVKLALRIGESSNKEVLPIVWHKSNTSIKSKRFSLAPVNQFEFFVKTILATTYNNSKVKGVIWWNSEEYDYNTRGTNTVYENQYRQVSNFNQYQIDLFNSYLNPIKKYF